VERVGPAGSGTPFALEARLACGGSLTPYTQTEVPLLLFPRARAEAGGRSLAPSSSVSGGSSGEDARSMARYNSTSHESSPELTR
jgi:hypothetical protein